MDQTNISRYQNPPQQAQYSHLSHMNSKQDYLDVFIINVLHRSPIIYVLINITLLIWLAQTIISSKIQQVPRSAYLISPFFGQDPIKDIYVASDKCDIGWEKVMLKTFPTIYQQSYTHKEMYIWGNNQTMLFCVKRMQPQFSLFEENGFCNRSFSCSGYCFNSQDDCPITAINIKNNLQTILPTQKIFYTSQDGVIRYVYSKLEGRPIVSLIATFHSRCANDYRYLDSFNKADEYYKTLLTCGPEGTINSIYDKIEQIPTKKFMFANNRGFGPNQTDLLDTQLGSIHQIEFNNDIYGQCINVRQTAKRASQYLSSDPVEPQFTQSLLVIGFILMMAQIIWLIFYICLTGYFHQKNILVILACIIQLTVITFIYSQNSKLFSTQQVIRSIANCIQSQVTAASTWNFGLQSSSSFVMIQYIGTIFLALYFFCYLLDKVMFGTENQIYRNYSYEDQDNQQDKRINQD